MLIETSKLSLCTKMNLYSSGRSSFLCVFTEREDLWPQVGEMMLNDLTAALSFQLFCKVGEEFLKQSEWKIFTDERIVSSPKLTVFYRKQLHFHAFRKRYEIAPPRWAYPSLPIGNARYLRLRNFPMVNIWFCWISICFPGSENQKKSVLPKHNKGRHSTTRHEIIKADD